MFNIVGYYVSFAKVKPVKFLLNVYKAVISNKTFL